MPPRLRVRPHIVVPSFIIWEDSDMLPESKTFCLHPPSPGLQNPVDYIGQTPLPSPSSEEVSSVLVQMFKHLKRTPFFLECANSCLPFSVTFALLHVFLPTTKTSQLWDQGEEFYIGERALGEGGHVNPSHPHHSSNLNRHAVHLHCTFWVVKVLCMYCIVFILKGM